MNPTIQKVIEKINLDSISTERKGELDLLVDYVQNKKDKNEAVLLNFICTHNSRRSQLSQLWASVASHFYKIPIESFSGGVEVTACNERVIASLERFGFDVSNKDGENPRYQVSYDALQKSRLLFSKMYDSEENPTSGFAAIMTCDHADENCPYIAGCEVRIPIRYEDPKAFDDSPLEAAMYDYRSFQIATELFYVFSKIN
jgi:arsenate reductase (thioredoxin)